MALSESAFGATEKSNTRTNPLGTAKVCNALQKKWDTKVHKAELAMTAADHKWRAATSVHGMVGMGSDLQKQMVKNRDQYWVTIQQMEQDQISNSCPQTYCGQISAGDGHQAIDLCLNKNKPIKSNKES